VSFVATSRAEAARDFYANKLGFCFAGEDRFALLFRMPDGGKLRVQKVEQFEPQTFTVLGWEVEDISEAVQALAAKGVEFVRVPNLPQDGDGVWSAPDGTRVAWFKDPDGNTLSLAEHPATL